MAPYPSATSTATAGRRSLPTPRRAPAALAALVVLALAAATARGADPPAPNLVFEDEHALKLRLRQLAPVEMRVCNLGDAGATAEARLVGFAFVRAGEIVATDTVLKLTPTTVSVDARDCSSVTLSAADDAFIPDAGDYTGALVVRRTAKAGTVSILRRDVTVTAERRAAAKPAAAVDELTLAARRGDPMFDDTIGFVAPAAVPLALAVDPSRSEWPRPGTVIGVVTNGRHHATISVAGAPVEGNRGWELPLSLAAPAAIGTYSGSVDLGLAGDEAVPVKLKVEASDGVGWAVAAVLVGLLLAALVIWLMQKGLVRWGLRRRRRDLDDDFKTAQEQFDEKYGGAKFDDYKVERAAVTAYQQKVETAAKRWAKDNVLVDRDRDDFKALVRLIQDAEADAAFFGDADGFGKTMGELVVKRDGFVEAFPNTVPAFLAHINERLTGKSLPVGGATEAAAKAKEHIALVDNWSTQARLLKRLAAWIALLEQEPLSNDDRQRVEEAKVTVEVCRRAMLDAATAAALKSAQVAKQLNEVYARLAVIGAKHGIWIPAEQDVKDDPFDPAAQFAGVDAAGVPAAMAEIGGFIVDVAERTGKNLTELLVFAFAVVTAVLVALPTVFSDETFGTWRDYLAALGLGAVGAATAKGLFETLATLRRRERV